jgi:hypothetical protein
MRDDKEKKDYEVGYGKPPKSGQFKKGVSGNPLGRPKKASDFGSQLIREFNSELIINENGKRKVTTKGEAFVKQLVNKALSLNPPVIRLLVPWYQQALEKSAEEHLRALDKANCTADDLTDDDLAAIILGDSK